MHTKPDAPIEHVGPSTLTLTSNSRSESRSNARDAPTRALTPIRSVTPPLAQSGLDGARTREGIAPVEPGPSRHSNARSTTHSEPNVQEHDQNTDQSCPSCRNPITRHARSRSMHLPCLPAVSVPVPWMKRERTCTACGWRDTAPRLPHDNTDAPRELVVRSPVAEMNPWYRTAESWHRPPSFVLRGHDFKGPTLRVEEDT